MRGDDALLLDILIAARKICQFTEDLSREDFFSNQMAQSAVIREFQVIGEAARMVTQETKNQHNTVSWPAITGLRNRLVHEYFNIDLDIVWDTIRENLPDLITHFENIVPPEE